MIEGGLSVNQFGCLHTFCHILTHVKHFQEHKVLQFQCPAVASAGHFVLSTWSCHGFSLAH